MKSEILYNHNFVVLVKRMELSLEHLLNSHNTVVSTSITQSAPEQYYGVIFYTPNNDPQHVPAVAIKVIPFPGGVRTTPGGCVSVPSLSEQMEEILEPRPWDHAPIAVNQMGRD